ncbi:hypothetical protein V8D89_009671 [Ganoderma adspersum]
MSSQSDSAAAEVIALASVLYQAYHCILGSTCFLIYDYVITFGREVNLFWTHKYTGASVLFFLNRYVTLVWNIMGLAQLGQISEQPLMWTSFLTICSCPVYYKVFSAISYSQYIIWAAFSGLRAYALSRSRVLAIFLFVLASVPAGINYAQFRFGLTGVTDPDFGCFSSTNLTHKLAVNPTKRSLQTVVISSRTCLITTDTILLVLTWATLGRRDAASKFNLNSRWSLSTIMFRDGTVLLSLNVLHLAFTLSTTFGHLISNISLFEDEITAVLVSRFLLDLQTANQRSLKLGSSDPLHLSTRSFDGGGSVAFARIVGSLGEGFVGPGSLVSDPDDDDDISETCYWSHSAGEAEEIELADKVGKSGDTEAAIPDVDMSSESHPGTDMEQAPVTLAKELAK